MLERLKIELDELDLRWQVVGRSGRPHDPANVCASCDDSFARRGIRGNPPHL